jgi:hypothetical protein
VKTLKVSGRSRAIRQILDLASREDVLLETANGDEFLLSAIDDFGIEIARQRRNKKLMAFLTKRFRDARREKAIPLDEVRRRLGLTPNGSKVTRRKTGSHPR